MNANKRFYSAVIILGLFMTGPFVLTACLVYADLKESDRATALALLKPHLPIGTILTIIGFVLGVMLLRTLFRQYVRGLLSMSEQLRLMVSANRQFRVPVAGPPEVQALANAANELATARDQLLTDVEAQIASAKASVESEKNRLAALISELGMGVVVCNREGRIMLYNQRARLQFKSIPSSDFAVEHLAQNLRMVEDVLLGLGRSIYNLLSPEQIAHALENIQHRLNKGVTDPNTSFVTSTRQGHFLRVQLTAVLDTPSVSTHSGAAQNPIPTSSEVNGINTPQTHTDPINNANIEHNNIEHVKQAEPENPQHLNSNAHDSGNKPPQRIISGYVLTLDNLSRNFEREVKRDGLIAALTESYRNSLGYLNNALYALTDEHQPQTFDETQANALLPIRQKVEKMQQQLNTTSEQIAEALKTRWPLDNLLSSELLQAAARQIEHRLHLPTKTEEIASNLWVRADAVSLSSVMFFLAARLVEDYEIRELRLRSNQDGGQVGIDLIWSGQPISSETLYTWELEPMTIGTEVNPLTVRDIISRHNGDILFQREKKAHRVFLRIVLPLVESNNSEVTAVYGDAEHERPEFYDFNLFQSTQTEFLDCPLSSLTYTVFDTETTGLEPANGDEIIQIGAVRMVNGRVLRAESFEQIIDPGIPLKLAGIPIHGITEDMVRGQPKIAQVLPLFHQFCSDTVLVAHNAAFDMRFLALKEAETGLSFNQPVLDTLLLSSVLHPNQDSHKLEQIAQRLGVTIIGRHTALGDAFVTAEVFQRMINLLADQGIVTLRQALAAAENTYFARIKY